MNSVTLITANKYLAAYQSASSNQEKIHFGTKTATDATQVIVDIYIRFLFKQAVFSARDKSIFSSKELNEMTAATQGSHMAMHLFRKTLIRVCESINRTIIAAGLVFITSLMLWFTVCARDKCQLPKERSRLCCKD